LEKPYEGKNTLAITETTITGFESYDPAGMPEFVREPIRVAALVPEDGSFFFGDEMALSTGERIPVPLRPGTWSRLTIRQSQESGPSPR
jgi:hypothetical protein